MAKFIKSLLGVTKEAKTAIANGTEDLHLNLLRQNYSHSNERYYGGELIHALEALANRKHDYYFIEKLHFDIYYHRYLQGDKSISYENANGKQSIFFDVFNANHTWHVNIIRLNYQKDYDTVMLFDGAYSSTINAARGNMTLQNSLTFSHSFPQVAAPNQVDISEEIQLISDTTASYFCNSDLEIRRVVNFALDKFARTYTTDDVKRQYSEELIHKAEGIFAKKNDLKIAHIKSFIGEYLIEEISAIYSISKNVDHSDYPTRLVPKVYLASSILKQRVTALN